MGHYDSCRDGYCSSCGAAPGNMVNGKCPFCTSRHKPTPSGPVKQFKAAVAKKPTFGSFIKKAKV